MGFRELKKDFEAALAGIVAGETASVDRVHKIWTLRLLFEIAGNLDSLVVSNRNAEKHIEKMATAYSDLVKIQKDKAVRDGSR